MEFKFRHIFSGNIEASVIAEFQPSENAEYSPEGTMVYPSWDERIEIQAVIILGVKDCHGGPSENDDADMLEYLNPETVSKLEVEGLEHFHRTEPDES